MRDSTLYIWIGVWLLLLPFFGIPGSWKETLLILTALFLIAYSLVRRRKISDTKNAADNSAADESAASNQGRASGVRTDSDTVMS